MSDTAPRDVTPVNPDGRRRARAPIHTSGGRAPTAAEFDTARRMVKLSGILEPLRARLDHVDGRPRSLSVEGFLVGMQINALRRHHVAEIVEVARVLNTLSARQLDALGIANWDPVEAYDRVDRLFILLFKALEAGWDAAVDGEVEHIDADWFLERWLRASLEELPATSSSQAIDGTDIQGWARLHGELAEDDLDGEVEDDAQTGGKRRPKKKRPVKVLGVGPDGRNIYTKDLDARAGHRSTTNSRPGGEYVGYELHIGVQIRDVGWSDGIQKLNLGPDVPPVIKTASLVPAGSRRDDSVVPKLIDAKESWLDVDEVVWDRGYSQLRPETTSHPLNQAGISQTFRMMDWQRKLQPFDEHASLIEGHLVSAHAPTELQELLPMPPYGSTHEKREEFEAAFNRLAHYRLERHAGPDADGTTRWTCPFHSGRLRSRSIPETMRGSRTAPLVDLPEGASCCGGIVSVQAGELPYWQRFFPGTTAWRVSYRRRDAVEGVNGALKGTFVNIGQKFFKVFGLIKIKLLLAFTLAAYNLEAIRSFRARKTVEAEEAKKPRPRRKRRKETWRDVVAIRPETGPDPPPA